MTSSRPRCRRRNMEAMQTKEIAKATTNQNIAFDGNIFSGSQQFALAQRMSQALAGSSIIPKDYQGNISNCMIALEMASRLGTSPMMVMQNLYIVNGRPAWSSQYIIAMINSSRKYKTELQYHMEGEGDKLSCYAYAEDYNGHTVKGPVISMEMAKNEGWLGKNGSKWKTMPEVMIRYRAASFFGRLNCPDMIMGIYSTDEVIELGEQEYRIEDAIVVAEHAANEEAENKANSVPIDGAASDVKEVEESAEEAEQERTPEADAAPDF